MKLIFLALLVAIAASQWTDCRDGTNNKGDDQICYDANMTAALGYCCVYSWSKVGDADKTESWRCGLIKNTAEWIKENVKADDTNTNDDNTNNDNTVKTEGNSYCNSGSFMKASFVLAALISLFAF